MLSARSADQLNTLAAELPGLGHEAIACDVTNSRSVGEAFGSIGMIDGVVYCAGTYEPMSAREPDIAALQKVVDVIRAGALQVLGQVVPTFVQRRAGHIVCPSSAPKPYLPGPPPSLHFAAHRLETRAERMLGVA